MDLKKDSVIKLFFYYFIPALCAMLALSTYSTIDGIFVGKKIGENGLAAIGICWPIFPAFIAFELLFGFGGAAIVSYFLGKNATHRARLVFSSIFYFVAISSVIIGVVGFLFASEIMDLLIKNEANENIQEIKSLALAYLKIIFLGTPFFILHPLSDIFVVNDKRPILATFSMIVGSGSNIILNYIFLFKLDMGIQGSALASLLAHFIGFVILFVHFISKSGKLYFVWRFSLPAIISSAKTGIPESVSEVSASIVMLLFNAILLSIAGEKGLQIYSIMMYCGIVFFTILLSVTQAMQPLASFNYGAGNFTHLRQIFRFSLFMVVFMGVFMYGVFYCFDSYLVGMFLKNDIKATTLLDETIAAISVYYLGYIILGVNMVCAIFLQSVQRTASSFIITICYTILFLAVILPFMSYKYGINGAWIAYPLSQICALVIALCVMAYEVKFGIFSGSVQSGRILWKRRRNDALA